QQKADKKCPTLHTGSARAGTKKYLALTFIDTLLSSQRTHAHTFTPVFTGTSVRQLFQLSSFVDPIKIGLPIEPV
ncbi:hypothetical protein, partial [Nocardia sputi]|uniref:hypothetical protein n=1 Tax=Nocardia sputi TaxID=2943705 RepID=UPI0020C0BE88